MLENIIEFIIMILCGIFIFYGLLIIAVSYKIEWILKIQKEERKKEKEEKNK